MANSLAFLTVSKASSLYDGLVVFDVNNRRRVAVFSMFLKIHCCPNHALKAALPDIRVPAKLTYLFVSVYVIEIET